MAQENDMVDDVGRTVEARLDFHSDPGAPGHLASDEIRELVASLRQGEVLLSEPRRPAADPVERAKGAPELSTILLSLSSGMVPTLLRMLVDWRQEKTRANREVALRVVSNPVVLSPDAIEAALAANVRVVTVAEGDSSLT